MQVSLCSGSYNIIDSGQVFLFGEDSDFVIHISANDGFEFSIRWIFSKDDSGKQEIIKKIEENTLVLSCLNFHDSGTGLTSPARIARIDDRELYLMFWSYLEGQGKGKARSVKYTLFYEK